MENHKTAVAAISKRIKEFDQKKQPFRIFHGSTNSTRRSQYTSNNTVDTSQLTHVLEVNHQKKTAFVEPNVPMDKLVEATLRFGLIPPVVMEFPGITTGGGFSGTSGESSSFRYGFFDRTVLSVEMVLGDGDVITASKESNSGLFLGAASAFGTLGVTTLVELRLLEAKPFVELTYHPITGASDAVEKIEQLTDDASIDYLDGILYSKESGIICSGRLIDEPHGLKVQGFMKPSEPWFYLHAEKILRANKIVTEAVPLVDYLFRYDRGGFWVGKYAFQYFITPFNHITRRILNRFMHTRVMYHALHKSGHAEQYIIQDVAVPYQAAEEFVEYLDTSFGHYPLWLCPLLQTTESPMSPRSIHSTTPNEKTSKMLLNVGVWGPGPRGRDAFVQANRLLERKVYDLGGKKWLYAHAYYTEEEFWQIYDRKTYDALRAKYHATYLPTIYDKVKVDVAAEKQAINESWIKWILVIFWSVWPLSGVYGVLHTVFRTNYLMRPTEARENKSKDD